MYLFLFSSTGWKFICTVCSTVSKIICLSDVLMMAHIILYCSKKYEVIG